MKYNAGTILNPLDWNQLIIHQKHKPHYKDIQWKTYLENLSNSVSWLSELLLVGEGSIPHFVIPSTLPTILRRKQLFYSLFSL